MKKMKVLRRPASVGLLSVSFALGFAYCSLAAVSGYPIPPFPTSSMPVVTIRPTQPYATWSGTPGVFTLYRAGNPEPSLSVYCQIGGSAINGTDYQMIGALVPIPSGVMSADVVIRPINHNQVVTKDVTLQLGPSPLMGPLMPVNYRIGEPSSATVQIVPGPVTNVPPIVRIAYPTDSEVFYNAPLNVPLVACANDFDGFVVSVEFFANNVSLGTVTKPVTILPLADTAPLPSSVPPYGSFVLIWSNAPPGTNIVLTAKATDNGGASRLSAPISITLSSEPPPSPPPITNFPPVVRITSPPNGASFIAPVDIPICAYAADRDGYVTSVGFFAGTNFLGLGHRANAANAPGVPVPSPVLLTNLWEFTWSNAPEGTFGLKAVAVDDDGASTISPVVNVTIRQPPSPTPPTNVVCIIAKDPIAIEGTNCWPWLGLAATTPTWANWGAPTSVCRYFTNCGPKNALFMVRRLGATNTDLTVTYDVGGTATNGVDYLPLSGTVTILAGQRAAMITLVPLDDGPPDITSTVVLKLTPSADYKLGFPSRAAAIILDGPMPPRASSMLPDRSFYLSASGPDGAWYHVEYSSDLRNWTPACTNQVFSGAIDFVDPEASVQQMRYYRAVPETVAPMQ
jgi:hypothetical protein